MWIVISVTCASSACERVLVGDERDLLQEARERRLLALAAELARDADELLEVLDPAARLDRPLGLERLERARAVEHGLDELVDLELLAADLSDSITVWKPRTALTPAVAEPGGGGVGHRVEERDPERLGVADEALDRRVADPAPRPVRDPHQRDGVRRVVEHLQVRDGVLDLGALVEARPADHLVRDALPDEHVLEHP